MGLADVQPGKRHRDDSSYVALKRELKCAEHAPVRKKNATSKTIVLLEARTTHTVKREEVVATEVVASQPKRASESSSIKRVRVLQQLDTRRKARICDKNEDFDCEEDIQEQQKNRIVKPSEVNSRNSNWNNNKKNKRKE